MTNIETAKVLNSFFRQFAPSYLENSVPLRQEGLYITYSLNNGAFGEEGLIQAHIYKKDTSIQELLIKADEIAEAIGHSGTLLRGETGGMWIYKESPFVQVEPLEEQDLKAVYITMTYRNF